MKGVVLANCGKLGLNPADLSLSCYLETLAATQAAENPDGGGTDSESPERLKRFLSAHGVAGHA